MECGGREIKRLRCSLKLRGARESPSAAHAVLLRYAGADRRAAFRIRAIRMDQLARPRGTPMQSTRLKVVGWMAVAIVVVGCASAAATTSASPSAVASGPYAPLGARLTAAAKTGPQVPLRFDPNAHVVIATVPDLPAASFSAAQATRGEQVFDQTCATCHQGDRFIGANFVDAWNNRRVNDFYSLVRSTMPVDNPGGLKDQEYLDVVAYLLKANHATPTADSLSADTTAMRGHKIAVHP
jgi:mono/diheme cytochrome c family protein